MAKLLNSRLPLASSAVDAALYNRMVRILEINLGKFDPTATPQYTDVQIGQKKVATGDGIWNLSKDVLQVYTGSQWQDLSTRTPVGLEATGSVGTLTVATNGSTTISL